MNLKINSHFHFVVFLLFSTLLLYVTSSIVDITSARSSRTNFVSKSTDKSKSVTAAARVRTVRRASSSSLSFSTFTSKSSRDRKFTRDSDSRDDLTFSSSIVSFTSRLELL